MHALISIHDVMPSTLNRVSRLTQDLTHLQSCNITMLVVPGHQWSREQLDVLREFEQQGYILCGHGWHHSSKKIRGVYHRLHSLLVSRHAAEHLALDEKEITAADRGLPPVVCQKQSWRTGSLRPPCLGHGKNQPATP